MASEQMQPDVTMFHAIHECVYGSTVRHILTLPLDQLIHYLSTTPFYRGADTLYYLLLQREGAKVHYSANGRHLVSIQSEFAGVYIMAGQDPNAMIIKDTPGETISPILRDHITRTVSCQRYRTRQLIMSGDAPFPLASSIPSISLNIQQYQHNYETMVMVPSILLNLITNDCWEPVRMLDEYVFPIMLDRMTFVKATMPNLWNLVLCKYYAQQLQRLHLHVMFPEIASRQLLVLNGLFPDIIRLPTNLDAISVRLWFCSKLSRAYLLGLDIRDGIPSDAMISACLNHLQHIGIEKYVDEITLIRLDAEGLLTGRIGTFYYPQIVGKKLLNTVDLGGMRLNMCYPADMYPLTTKDGVVIITRNDMGRLLQKAPDDSTESQLKSMISPEYIPYLTETPSEETLLEMITWFNIEFGVARGTPARTKLVEMMSWDLVR